MRSWVDGALLCNNDVGTIVGLIVTVRLKKMEMRLKTTKSLDFQIGSLVLVNMGGLVINTVELLEVILPLKAHKNQGL